MTVTADITALRLQLRKAGYDPLPVAGKAPAMTGWPEKFNTGDDEIRFWSKMWEFAENTGINATFTPGIDIDIFDEEAAETVEALAHEFFEERGNILVRFGLRPRRLIPLRTDEPFKKLSREFVGTNGNEQKIEILGDGQQWVAFGTHPETQQPYTWFGGDLATTPRASLPDVRREDAKKFLDAATKLLTEQ